MISLSSALVPANRFQSSRHPFASSVATDAISGRRAYLLRCQQRFHRRRRARRSPFCVRRQAVSVLLHRLWHLALEIFDEHFACALDRFRFVAKEASRLDVLLKLGVAHL